MYNALTLSQFINCIVGSNTKLIHGKFKSVWWEVNEINFVHDLISLFKVLDRKCGDFVCIYNDDVKYLIAPQRIYIELCSLQDNLKKLSPPKPKKSRVKKEVKKLYEVFTEKEVTT
jgi:bifunctional DNA-binding transcriptional regulator/antitoxin component of YhaV-PrlF toxin-antitoxin module